MNTKYEYQMKTLRQTIWIIWSSFWSSYSENMDIHIKQIFSAGILAGYPFVKETINRNSTEFRLIIDYFPII